MFSLAWSCQIIKWTCKERFGVVFLSSTPLDGVELNGLSSQACDHVQVGHNVQSMFRLGGPLGHTNFASTKQTHPPCTPCESDFRFRCRSARAARPTIAPSRMALTCDKLRRRRNGLGPANSMGFRCVRVISISVECQAMSWVQSCESFFRRLHGKLLGDPTVQGRKKAILNHF